MSHSQMINIKPCKVVLYPLTVDTLCAFAQRKGTLQSKKQTHDLPNKRSRTAVKRYIDEINIHHLYDSNSDCESISSNKKFKVKEKILKKKSKVKEKILEKKSKVKEKMLKDDSNSDSESIYSNESEGYKVMSESSSDDEYKSKSESSSDDEYKSKYESSSDNEYQSNSKKSKVKEKMLKKNELSEYEKMILEKKQQSLAFLDSLKINEAKESFCKALAELKPERKAHQKKDYSLLVRRTKSNRTTKVNINLSEEALRRKNEEIAKKALEGIEDFSKRLYFEDVIINKKQLPKFTEEFADLDCEETKPFIKYLSHFENMKICAYVPFEKMLTSLAVHPVCDKIIIGIGDSYGQIIFRNLNSDSESYVFTPYHERVLKLQFNPYNSNLIASSSQDGYFCIGDFEKQVFERVYQAPQKHRCTYFECLTPTSYIVAQTNGNVTTFDTRVTRKSFSKAISHKCHNCWIKCVSVHPVNKDYFISTGLNGVIRLWDFRMLQQDPVFEMSSGENFLSCNNASAFFSPVTGNCILSSFKGNNICIFDSSNLGGNMNMIRKFRSCPSTLNRVATWLPNTDNTFVVGRHPSIISIYNVDGSILYDFENEQYFDEARLQEFHPSLPVLAAISPRYMFVFKDSI